MSHSFAVISDYKEQKRQLEPRLLEIGKRLPEEGHAIAFVEFDEAGEVVAFLFLQNKLFAEGLYCRDGTANIRTLWNMMGETMKQRFPGKDLLVMASSPKMSSVVCKRFKCSELPWKIFRREF